MNIHNPANALILVLAAPSFAQAIYDAGTPGQPPVAPSPITQGWSQSITGSGQLHAVSPDPNFPFNAWQVDDGGSGRVHYTHGHPWLGQEPYQ